mmetsp:Transcript_5686/g.10835  ORF Transcript_5686/g.10835 Transcript_5686/m.10835 type:complete len:80 (-) Transcript_5686:746-985(-)
MSSSLKTRTSLMFCIEGSIACVNLIIAASKAFCHKMYLSIGMTVVNDKGDGVSDREGDMSGAGSVEEIGAGGMGGDMEG